MDDLITLRMVQHQQNIKYAEQNYGKRLYGFIRNRVKNISDAEDILQDVWFQLSNIIDIEPIEQLSSWLFRVSRNKIVDKYRKNNPELLEDLAYEDDEGELIFPEALISDTINPEKELENTYFREAFFNALNELPEKQKDAFVWNELEDMTLQEIANKTGDNIKTIISRKRYAVAHLRRRLQSIYNEY